MNAWPVRNTATRRHSMFQSTVFCSRFQLIKNPDVSIATNVCLFIQNQRNSNQALNLKENNIKAVNQKKTTSTQQTKKKHQALKKTISIYLCTKQRKEIFIAHS